jgi:hypothetical protein
MGSMIHLAVGRLEIDWGKNSGFTDHSPLFQPTDLAQVPYYYVKEGGKTYVDSSGQERYELFAEYKDGMSKPLGQVVDRIELLGLPWNIASANLNTFLSSTPLTISVLPLTS